MRVEHCGQEHLLHLETREVALLIDILEAALPAEGISGPRTSNPPLSGFFNDVYARLIDTARVGWERDAAPAR
ncbi:MAG: hypothetical protein ACK5FE_07020 [Cyanobacteriota bacterium]